MDLAVQRRSGWLARLGGARWRIAVVLAVIGPIGILGTVVPTQVASADTATVVTGPQFPEVVLSDGNTDGATVTGDSTYGSPTGTVSFYVCGPTTSAEPCTSQSDPVGTAVALTPGANNTATADSVSFTATAPGTWCFGGYYSGDSNYGAGSDTSTDECFDVTEEPTSTSPAAWGWGNYPGNDSGNSEIPVTVSTGTGTGQLPPGDTITAVAAGSDGADLALDTEGDVYAWGDNSYGELGLPITGKGGELDSEVPVQVKVPGIVSAIAEGGSFSLALDTDGDVYAWGNNTLGQLGNGAGDTGGSCAPNLPTDVCDYTPVEVKLTNIIGGQAVEAIAAEGNGGLVLTSKGAIYAWGSTDYGQLGNGALTGDACAGECQDVALAVTLPGGVTFQAIAGGGDYALAETTAGALYGWGDNSWGELGTGSYVGDTPAQDGPCNGNCWWLPVAVTLPQGVTVGGVSAGYNSSIALSSTGAVYGWGDTTDAELGTTSGNACSSNEASSVCNDLPGVLTNLPGQVTVSEVSAGYQYDLAVTSAGAVFAWGATANGELGDGSTTGDACNGTCQDSAVLAQLPIVSSCAQCIDAGGQSVAITSSATPPGVLPCTETPLPASCEVVPTTGANAVPDDCSVDVTVQLYKLINSFPQGTPNDPIEVEFAPGGCYLVNGMLFLRGFQDYIFDGNGSTFEQQSVTSLELTKGDPPPTRAPYCDAPNLYGGASDAANALAKILYNDGGPPDDIMWFVEGGCDLEFGDMTIDGAGSTNGSKTEQDSAFEVAGAQRVLVTGNDIQTVYGDCTTVTGLNEASFPGNYPSSDVTVTGNKCNSTGRDGVSIVYANRVTVGGCSSFGDTWDTLCGTSSTLGNSFANLSGDGIDIESDSGDSQGGEGNLLVANNSFKNFAYLVAGLTQGQIFQFAFNDNTVDNMKSNVAPDGKKSPVGQNFTISGNTATAASTWPYAYDWNFGSAIGGLVSGNTVPICPSTCPKGSHSVPDFTNTGKTSGGFAVASNVLNGKVSTTKPVTTKLGASSGDSECNNTTPSGQSLDDGSGALPACNANQLFLPVQPITAVLPDYASGSGPPGVPARRTHRARRHSDGGRQKRSHAQTGVEPGDVSCSKMTGSVTFDPPLSTSSWAASEMALVQITLKTCSGSDGASTPTQGVADIEIPLATSNCASLSSPRSSATSLAINWSPASNGATEVVFPGYTPSSTSFSLGGSGTSVRGSYAGKGSASTAKVTLGKTAEELASACESSGGLASATVTGNVSL
jgi:alpha-tubulin suppressor-like RCC1 family protein